MTNIFLSLLGISISVSFIVIALILLTPFLNKRYAAKWKYLIWIFLALWLLVPFSGANGQLAIDMLSQIENRTETKSQEKHADTPADAAVPSGQIIVRIPSQMTTPITVQSEKNDAGITLLDIVAFIWMVGSLIFVSVHFISYFHYKRQVMKKGRIIEDTQILHQMFELKGELHIRHTIQAMEYDEAESPMIIGFLKPVLVLPKEQYSPEELFFILKHELVHFKRGDVFWKLLFVTANAVHWFNPFIWILQKEAVVDMELSCDERVTRGADYAVRKAYTETLLSMLHKRCARRTVLSTQFYGGTKVMKKRFRNILLKNKKKNGIFMLLCAVVLTIGLGTLVGCSIATEKGDAAMDADQTEENKNTKMDADQAEKKEEDVIEVHRAELVPDDDTSVNDDTETKTLTFSKEGEEEQKQATLTVGDGYSISLPDDEWQQSDSDMWTASENEQVQIWIEHYKDESLDSVAQKLTDNGYVTVQDYNMQKQEGDLIYNVGLKKIENDVWGIFYCYPADSEEGWGSELPVIADTFTLSVMADEGKQ